MHADIERALADATFPDDPYPIYDAIRETAPLYYSEAWGCWLTARYDLTNEMLRDVETFGNAGRVLRFIDQLDDDEVKASLGALYDHFSVGLINSDPPDHTRLRRLISKAFTPRTVERLVPRVTELVDELIDTMIADRGTDLVRYLAYPLPAIVIAEMLGVPASDRDQFKEWSDAIVGFIGSGAPESAATLRANNTVIEARPWLSELADHRRHHPQDDLLTALVEAEDAGDRLTEAELLSTCMTLLVAGHDTTTSLLGSAVLELISEPRDVASHVFDDEALRRWIEETLRFHSPLQRNLRVARRDAEVAGVRIEAGQRVEQLIGGANRDPAQFARPNVFDPDRGDNRHLGFGMGIHFCIGAPLSRMEAPIAIRRIVKRLGEFALLEPVEWRRDTFVRSLVRLELDYDVAAAEQSVS